MAPCSTWGIARLRSQGLSPPRVLVTWYRGVKIAMRAIIVVMTIVIIIIIIVTVSQPRPCSGSVPARRVFLCFTTS